MLIEYDGTAFHGWQIQPGVRTVHADIQQALDVAVPGNRGLTGSGRTDTGVHARGQVAHVDVPRPIDPFKVLGSLNGLTDKDIAFKALQPVEADFHARFDATRREYRYHVSTLPVAIQRSDRIWLRPVPNFKHMNEALNPLPGEHDFTSFCRTGSDTENRVCSIEMAQWVEESEEGYWRFEIAGDRFLHGMVRTIVGTCLEIGRGKRKTDAFVGILEARDRVAAGPAALARGLTLYSVDYG